MEKSKRLEMDVENRERWRNRMKESHMLGLGFREISQRGQEGVPT